MTVKFPNLHLSNKGSDGAICRVASHWYLDLESDWMGPNIYDYYDFRLFVRDELKHLRQVNPRFSTREFCRRAGFANSNYLKLLLEGKRALTEEGIRKLIRGLNLRKREAVFFGILIRFHQARDFAEMDRIYHELRKFKNVLKIRRLEIASYDIFSKWYIVAALEALGTRWAQLSERKMADSLSISVEELRRAFEILEDAGLVERAKGGGGFLRRLDVALKTPPQFLNLNVRNLHREMILKALESVDKIPVEEREIAGLTIALSEKSFREIRQKMAQFRKEINAMYSEDREVSRIYQFNLQLIPLCAVDGKSLRNLK